MTCGTGGYTTAPSIPIHPHPSPVPIQTRFGWAFLGAVGAPAFPIQSHFGWALDGLRAPHEFESTVCIRLCDAGPLQGWAQYHRTCARLWSRYLHRLKSRCAASKRCQGLQRRCLPIAPSNTRQKKKGSSATLVFALSCEKHFVLLSDGAHVILEDKSPLHRTATLFLGHPQRVYNQTSVFQQRDHL